MIKIETKAEVGATAHTQLGDYASAIQSSSEVDRQRMHEALGRAALERRVAREPFV